jgi:hypothetical protein
VTSRTAEVLAAIDAAVEDWESGPDAARWHPDVDLGGHVADFARRAGIPVWPWQERALAFVYDDTTQSAGIMPYGSRSEAISRTYFF